MQGRKDDDEVEEEEANDHDHENRNLIRSFCQQQRAWLDLELQAEADLNIHNHNDNDDDDDEGQRALNSLHQLHVDDVSVGLLGRTVVRLVPIVTTETTETTVETMENKMAAMPIILSMNELRQRLRLPAHRFTTGDEVEIIRGSSSSSSSSSSLSSSSKVVSDKENPSGGGGGGGGRNGNGGSSYGGKKNTTQYHQGVICEVTEISISVALSSSTRSRTRSRSRSRSRSHNKSHRNRNHNTTGSSKGTTTTGEKTKTQQQEETSHSDDNDNHHTNNEEDEDEDDDFVPPLSIRSRSSVEVHKKLVAALHRLETHGDRPPPAQGGGGGTTIVRALFHPASIMNIKKDTTEPQDQLTVNPIHHHLHPAVHDRDVHIPVPILNHSQQHAVACCLDPHVTPVSLIHGPPGTGKTTTLQAVIRQAIVQHGWKVLVTAPSNVAVDQILRSTLMVTTTNSSTSSSSSSTTTTTTSRSTKQRSTNNSKSPKNKASRSNNTAAAASSSSHQQQQQRCDHRPQQQMRINAVRLGHPARMQPDILPYSLDALVQNHQDTQQILAEIRNELQEHLRSRQQSFSSSSSSSSSRGMMRRQRKRRDENGKGQQQQEQQQAMRKREIALLRKELRVREEKVVTELLANAHVIFATCVGAASRHVQSMTFDLVVIDEAAQALEVACWIPALLCKTKLVLAGDHRQLPPTIQSRQVQKQLGYTMFERIMNQAPWVSRMLQVQYRMHHTIADWSSAVMYEGRLESHESVREHTLAQLLAPSTSDIKNTSPDNNNDNNEEEEEEDEEDEDEDDDESLAETSFLLIDTATCGMHESVNAAGSRFNTGEAELVSVHVKRLFALGLTQEQVCVITPYNGQVEILRNALSPEYPFLEIKSVDGFQGGEREAVIISLVRSSPRSGMAGIGFLREERRLNVAITRSRRHCCVICDSNTVRQNDFLRSLCDYIGEHGTYKSATDYFDHIECIDVDVRERLEKDLLAEKFLLIDKIHAFSATALPGAEMRLTMKPSRSDQKLVHDLAETLRIGHENERVEGVTRHIKLFIPQLESVKGTQLSKHGKRCGNANRATESHPDALTTDTKVKTQMNKELTQKKSQNIFVQEYPPPLIHSDTSSFLILGETSSTTQQHAKEKTETKDQERILHFDAECDLKKENDVPSREVMVDVARERTARPHHTQPQPTTTQLKASSNPKLKKDKPGGQKLGGSVKDSLPHVGSNDNESETLDDMAFLDAEIDKIQTAHGRKFEGKGGYRTVINGILTSTPKPAQPVKRDARASAALQTKLKKAQDGRKSKIKSK